MKSFCQSIWFKRSLAVFLLLTLLLGILPKHAVRATELTEESAELPSIASVEADTQSAIGEILLLDAIETDAEVVPLTSAVIPTSTPLSEIMPLANAVEGMEMEFVDITFDANGGKFADDSSSETVTLEKGSTTYPLTPIRLGYKLTGWAISGETIGEWDQITADVSKTYTAIWVETVDISFDANGGKFADDSSVLTIQVEKGKPFAMQEPEKRIGFDIIGWTSEGIRYDRWGEKIADKSRTFVVEWSEAYPITFNGNGGLYGDSPTITVYVAKGEMIPSYQTIRAGYIQTGWLDNEGNYFDWYDFLLNQPAVKPITYTAVWEKSYWVKFDANGGKLSYSDNIYSQEFYKGQKLYPWEAGSFDGTHAIYRINPIRTGHRFMGYEYSDGTFVPESLLEETYVDVDLEKSITLKAIWSPIGTTVNEENNVPVVVLVPRPQKSDAKNVASAKVHESTFAIPVDQVVFIEEATTLTDNPTKHLAKVPDLETGEIAEVNTHVYDLHFEDLEGNKIQPKPGESVEVDLPFGDLQPESLQVFHVGPDGPELVSPITVVGERVYFTATGFSVYYVQGVIIKNAPEAPKPEEPKPEDPKPEDPAHPNDPTQAGSDGGNGTATTPTSSSDKVETTTTTTAAVKLEATTTTTAETNATTTKTELPRTGESGTNTFGIIGVTLLLSGVFLLIAKMKKQNVTDDLK